MIRKYSVVTVGSWDYNDTLTTVSTQHFISTEQVGSGALVLSMHYFKYLSMHYFLIAMETNQHSMVSAPGSFKRFSNNITMQADAYIWLLTGLI